MNKIRDRKIHRGDYVAVCKMLTGDWIFDLVNGEIFSARTKQPLKFYKDENGYLSTSTRHRGKPYLVQKHRAIFAVGNGWQNLPEEYVFEVDHINKNKEDCRFENLRLVTTSENSTYAQGLFTYEEAEEIRAQFAKGNITKSAIAREYGCSAKTIRNIINGKTYVRGGK